MSVAFTEVELRHEDGSVVRMSGPEFLAIPLTVRVRHIIDHRVRFFLHGVELPAREALARLREAEVTAPASRRTSKA